MPKLGFLQFRHNYVVCTKSFITSVPAFYATHLRRRNATFVHHTRTRDAIHTILITTYGLKENMHSGEVYATITMDDLFQQ